MFYIFLLQVNDSEFDLTFDKSIDIAVDGIMCDADIGSSLDPIKMIEKSLKKIGISFVYYSFNRKQTRLKQTLFFGEEI